MAYSFQSWTLNQVLTSTQQNQVEVNIRDHVHGSGGVGDAFYTMTVAGSATFNGPVKINSLLVTNAARLTGVNTIDTIVSSGLMVTGTASIANYSISKLITTSGANINGFEIMVGSYTSPPKLVNFVRGAPNLLLQLNGALDTILVDSIGSGTVTNAATLSVSSWVSAATIAIECVVTMMITPGSVNTNVDWSPQFTPLTSGNAFTTDKLINYVRLQSGGTHYVTGKVLFSVISGGIINYSYNLNKSEYTKNVYIYAPIKIYEGN